LVVGCIFLLLEYTRKTLRNNNCPVWWTRISTYDRYSNGYWLCAPLPTVWFLHADEADFLQEIFKNKDKKLPKRFDSIFHYIYDVLVLNNSWFRDYLHLIYSNELKVKDATDTQKYVCYLDLHFEIANGWQWKTKLYKKRDDFTFPIFNYPFFFTHIPEAPVIDFTFHNSYVILGPSKAILWTERLT